MNRDQFAKLLKSDRPQALRLLFDQKVSEWLNDGPEEIARVLTNWFDGPGFDNVPDLNDDDEALEYAEACNLLDDDEPTLQEKANDIAEAVRPAASESVDDITEDEDANQGTKIVRFLMVCEIEVSDLQGEAADNAKGVAACRLDELREHLATIGDGFEFCYCLSRATDADLMHFDLKADKKRCFVSAEISNDWLPAEIYNPDR